MVRHKRKRHYEKEIDNRYIVEKFLGEGGFCIVFRAIDKENGERVAIKRMDKTKPLYRKFRNPKASEKLDNLMYREANIMRSLEHENIMRILDFIDDGTHIYIVMEFAEGGELWERLLKFKKFSASTTIIIIKQLISGVNFMHEQGFIHRDIKAENVLFKNKTSLTIVLTDFGLSKDADGLVYTNCGTLVYSAPELLLNKTHKKGYDKLVDNWAIGVLTFLLLSGHLPFDDLQQNDLRIKNKILQGKVFFPFSDWNKIPTSAKHFISKLLETDVLKRMELHEALQHHFLTKPLEEPRHHELHASKPIRGQYTVTNTDVPDLFPMMEASQMQTLARIRWKVVLYFCITIMLLKSELQK